jgi:hypothetical protein
LRVIEHSEVKEQAGLLRPSTHCVRTSGADVPMLLLDNHRCRAHSVTSLLQVARAGASGRDTKAPPIFQLSSRDFSSLVGQINSSPGTSVAAGR